MAGIWVNLKNVGPPFFQIYLISVYFKMPFKQLENHSQLLPGRDFENERLLVSNFGFETRFGNSIICRGRDFPEIERVFFVL